MEEVEGNLAMVGNDTCSKVANSRVLILQKILFLPYLQKSIWNPWCCCTTRKFTITLPNDLANCNVSLRLRWDCLLFSTGGEGTSLLSLIGNCLNKQPQRKKVCRWQNLMHTEHLYKFFCNIILLVSCSDILTDRKSDSISLPLFLAFGVFQDRESCRPLD